MKLEIYSKHLKLVQLQAVSFLKALLKKGSNIRLLRGDAVIYEGQLDSLKRFKDDVKEVKSNFECGISIKNFDDLQVNDKLEAYEHVQVARKL